MVEVTVKFFLFVDLLEDSQLNFTEEFVFEKDVDKDVIAFVLESVLYFDNLQELWTLLFYFVEHALHSFE